MPLSTLKEKVFLKEETLSTNASLLYGLVESTQEEEALKLSTHSSSERRCAVCLGLIFVNSSLKAGFLFTNENMERKGFKMFHIFLAYFEKRKSMQEKGYAESLIKF